MEVIDMLDEEEYLCFSPNYTDWNEEAGSPDELVLDYDKLDFSDISNLGKGIYPLKGKRVKNRGF